MSYLSQALTDGALSIWLQGDAGPTTAVDSGPAASNGTYNNTPTFGVSAPVGIQPVTAVSYPAANLAWMQAPVVAGNTVTDVFSLEFWVKRIGTGFNATYFSARHGTVGAPGGPAILTDAVNHIVIGGGGGAFTIGTTTATIADTTTWHHVIWTKNAAANKVYLDAVDVTPTITNTTFTAFTAGALWVVDADGGSGLPSSTGAFTFCAVAVYSNVLSAGQVTNHYQIGTATLPPVGPGGGGAFNSAFDPNFQPSSGQEIFDPFDSPQGFVRRRSGLHVPRPRRIVRPAERRIRVSA